MAKTKKKSKKNKKKYQPDVVLLGSPEKTRKDEEDKKNDRGCYSGYAEIPGVLAAHYHLTPQTEGSQYALRGTVSAIDKKTGRVMVLLAADLRDRTLKKQKKTRDASVSMDAETAEDGEKAPVTEGADSERGYDYGERVHREIYCKEDSAEAVSASVIKGVLGLFEKYPRYFAEEAVRTGAIGEMFFSFAADCFWPDFKATLTCNDDSAANILRNVMRVGTYLGLCKIKDISEEEIGRLCRKLGKNYRPYLLNASRFYNWLQVGKGAVLPENPFEEYLNSRGEKRKEHDRLRDQHNKKTVSADILSAKEETVYDKRIHNNIHDGKYVGFLIKKETDLSSEEACALRWKNVVFLEDGFVVVQHKRKEPAWKGYDMSFLTTRFFADEIRRRKEFVLKQMEEGEAIDELPVVTTSDDVRKPLTATILNVFLGKELSTVKCYGNMVANRRPTESAGTRLLERSYVERMEKLLGTQDPGLMAFMKHELPKMVMDKSYRSYTGPASHYSVKVMMNRDPRIKRKVLKENRIRMDDKTEPGRRILTVQARDPSQSQRIVLTMDLNASDLIRIKATHGVKIVSMKEVKGQNECLI